MSQQVEARLPASQGHDPRSLPGHRQRGMGNPGLLPGRLPRPAGPGSGAPAEPRGSDATRVLSKGLCVLCRPRSPEPSGLQHSALIWPTANVAAPFVTTASFCFFLFFSKLLLFILLIPCGFLGQDLDYSSFHKPETETRWVMHPAKVQCCWYMAHSTHCQAAGREISNPSQDHLGLSAQSQAALHISSWAGGPGGANGSFRFSGASQSLFLLWWQLVTARMAP